MLVIDIGCGKYKTENAIGIDFSTLPGIDVVHNLNCYPYPFPDNYADKIICHHILEHLDDVVATMQEIYRIGKNGATVHILVPHASSFRASWTDPTHKRSFTLRSFKDYFSSLSPFGYYSNTNFVPLQITMNYCLYNGRRSTSIPRVVQDVFNKIANSSLFLQEVFERYISAYIGGFEELEVLLQIKK